MYKKHWNYPKKKLDKPLWSVVAYLSRRHGADERRRLGSAKKLLLPLANACESKRSRWINRSLARQQRSFNAIVHTARPVNDATEGSTQVAPMCASCVLPRKVDQIVWVSVQFSFEKNDGCFLLCTSQACSCSSSIEGSTQEACRKHAGSTHHYLLRQNQELTPQRQLF